MRMRIVTAARGLRTAVERWLVLRRLRQANEVVIGAPVKLSWRRLQAAGGNRITIGNFVICYGAINCQRAKATVTVGDRSFIGSGSVVACAERVTIGSGVLISHECYLIDTDGHSMSLAERKNDIPNRWKGTKTWEGVQCAPITIADGAWIGPRVIILKGVEIGAGAVIGAGSVVTKSIPAWSFAAGAPARVIRQLDP
jgi:acetyltransferase-like isoleucine patch superfamily enzyme